MKIVFRVAYHTEFGQSLWLRLAVSSGKNSPKVESWFPMKWRNPRQWEVDVSLESDAPSHIEYHYQLRQENNALKLDEWETPRTQVIDPTVRATLLLEDTWRSAGTIDRIIRKSGFDSPNSGFFSSRPIDTEASHEFLLRIDHLPQGEVPYLIGSCPGLGAWNPVESIPLTPVKPGLWHAACELPDLPVIEYKYGLVDSRSGQFLSYELGENRIIEPRSIDGNQHTIISDEAYRHDPSTLPRASGVAIPVFSLRSESGLGVGEFADLKPFGDWAAEAGMSLIQILPINDTTSAHDWTDSYPYSAISAFALHPIYLRINELSVPLVAKEQKLLKQTRDKLNALPRVDYEAVMAAKNKLTKSVFARHSGRLEKSDEFLAFHEANRTWLDPYAAFCILRDRHGTADHPQWGKDARYSIRMVEAFSDPAHSEHKEFSYHIWLQFELDRQLRDAAGHLRKKGLALKGDLPIGIDRQSVEVWSQPHLFHTDRQAGAPPDAFAENGQNWGFPTYNWEAMAADGFAWWNSRLHHLGRYFGAFRIDHILGFFRIWQIPCDQIDGILGWFEPALPLSIEEIHARGIPFEFPRYCVAQASEATLREWLGDDFEIACERYLRPDGHHTWYLREEYSTQRKIASRLSSDDPAEIRIRAALLKLATEVLFLEVPGSNSTLFHPRCNLRNTRTFRDLDESTKGQLVALHDDYFYRRHEDYWQARGYEKLPTLRKQSPMLLCGEDLGMVPDRVPGVMRELGILSLEIQRMPKSHESSFAPIATAPYLSVVSPSTHDMSTLRGWWREDRATTVKFACESLGIGDPPDDLTSELAQRIIHQHVTSPAMWTIFPLQDLLAIDETLRHPDPDFERINVPAITPYYWRYRCHVSIEDLGKSTDFTTRLRKLMNRD